MNFYNQYFIILFLFFIFTNTGWTQEVDSIDGVKILPEIIEGISTDPNSYYFTLFDNIKVNQDQSARKQVEVSIDMNFNNPKNLVAAWIDYSATYLPRVAFGYSFNGGQTWNDGLLPQNLGGFPYQGDPIVASDKNGNFFIAIVAFGTNPYVGGVFVAKSIDGGRTWPEGSIKRLDSNQGIEDKTFMIIDRTNNNTANNIYVAWDYGFSTGSYLDIQFARSTNQGETFEPAFNVSDATRPNQLGIMLAIDVNGELFATWYAGNQYGFRDFYLDKSTNGGASFGNENVLRTVESYYSGMGINHLKRIYSFPFLIANPVFSGHLYLAWGNRVDGPHPRFEPDSSDVLFIRSTDYGSTWSSPINIINNELHPSVTPNDQFMPWISINPSGNKIDIMYYDRSDFINNDLMLTKVSSSIDDGISFTPPVRFANVPSFIEDASDFIGDYNGMISTSEGLTIPIWADDRHSNFDMYTAPGEITIISTSIVTNWQTLSVPLITTNYAKTIIWPTATSNAYKFLGSQGYVAQDILENGPGYYIKFEYVQTINFAGAALDQIGIPVSAGWNIVGSISNDIPISTNLCLFPAWNSFTTPFYLYQNGYIIVDHIAPGYGYWIKVDVDGTLLLNKDPIQCDSPEFVDVENFDHFIVTDTLGKKQDLYVANLNLDPSLNEIDLSMPPPLPEVGFDARFATGEYIKPIFPDSNGVALSIEVETMNYPVTLSWELNPENGIEYSFISDSILGKVSWINEINGQAEFTCNSTGMIKLFGKANYIDRKDQIPSGYELSQNYPNPFNPITTIKYGIPKTVNVELKVLDILGREVKTLVNNSRNPGYYEVLFNASNFASGVYLYMLKAGEYIKTGKMLLIK